jgi:hypothetical protein
MAIRTAIGAFVAAAILGVGAVSASAAPNPGFGLPGFPVPTQGGTSVTNPGPGLNFPFEQTADGPQTSNIPTLAWVGEDVRLVACDNDIQPNPDSRDGIAFQQAEWNTNLWTGDQAFQATPTFDGSQSTNFYLTNTGSASFFFPTGIDNIEHGCTSADISSLHAGLDEVTLNVYQQSALGGRDGQIESPAGGPGLNLDPTPVYSKQFIVIWMTANAPVLSEASVSSLGQPTTAGTPGAPTTVTSAVDQLTSTGTTNAGNFLGDTASLNTFPNFDWWTKDVKWSQSYWGNNTPASNNGLVDVKVTGSFPIEDAPPSTTNANYFASVATGGSVTLPDKWAALANLMATSSTQNTNDNINPTGGSLWDIHGGPTNAPGHAGSSTGICGHDAGPFSQSTDVVDDCVSDGAGHGNAFAFSRVFGDVTTLGFTDGPFDPLAADATLLSDGRLNSDDAPMPALPITLAITPNSGQPGDDGGVGGLYGVSKYRVYSHDFDVTTTGSNGFGQPVALESDNKTANLYNPYYQAYIPSTLRPIAEASGVTGVWEGGISGGSGTDFPGFSNGLFTGAPYPYWEALDAKEQTTTGTNTCFRSDLGDPTGSPVGDYVTPDYPNQITVYTDERGEAYVDYNPGNGWFDNGFVGDLNGACDLQALFGKEIGSSVISAKVNYPYESVPYFPPAGANTIKKVVDSQWSKTLTVVPKGNISGVDMSIVVIHAQDVTGQPFSGETVCLTDTPGIAFSLDQQPTVTVGGQPVDISGVYTTTDSDFGTGYFCVKLNAAGNAAVELAASGAPNVDVVAIFADEHISRDVDITSLGQSAPVSSTTPPTVLPVDKVVLQSGSNGGGGSAGGSSTSAPGATVAPPGGGLAVGSGNSCKVNSVHLYAKRNYATVKVTCTKSKTDSIVIRAFRHGGGLVHTYRKTIATGKTVRIRFSTRKVAHISVSV